MRMPLIMLPFAFLQLANALVSLRRLSAFLLAEDRVEYVERLERPGIRVEGATFNWPEPPTDVVPALRGDRGKAKKEGEEKASKWSRLRNRSRARDEAAKDAAASVKDAHGEKEGETQVAVGKESEPLFWLRDVNLTVRS